MAYQLTSAEELSKELGRVKVFDLRWSLTDPGHGLDSYLAGHIDGAVFVDLDSDLSAPTGDGRHPLPTLEDFAATLGRLGLTNSDRAVVYDDVSGAIASRMWWMLNSIGHPSVALLDGGLRSWTDAGYALSTVPARPRTARYAPVSDRFSGVVGHQDLQGRVIVDVRSLDRYTGAHEPVDPKAGHIPGAIHIPLVRNLSQDGRFLPPDELSATYREIAERPVVSCGSGVNACHTALAMVLAGRNIPDLYVGSFSDWSSRDLPVNTGPFP